MPIYKPAELIKYLDELGISPKKALSQNFLLDGNIIKKIVALSDLSPGQRVLEIGPGPGALTEALLNANADVIAVEKDEKLAKGLERLKEFSGKLEVNCADIFQFPLEERLSKEKEKAKLIANLPYHIATPILTRFITRSDLFSEIIVMVQDEVARRFTAQPCSKDYGSLTLFLNYYSKPIYGFKVSHNCFYPRPKVESAVVKFVLDNPKKDLDEDAFFAMVRKAFSTRRKMLTTTLKEHFNQDHIRSALALIGKSPTSRPEELSLNDFVVLFQELPQIKKFIG